MKGMPKQPYTTALLNWCGIALLALPMLYLAAPRKRVVSASRAPMVPTRVSAPESPEAAAGGRLPLQSFTRTVNEDLFRAGGASPPPAPRLARAEPVKRRLLLPQPRAEFAGYRYSGMARMGSSTLALIEEKGSGSGRFLRIGDSVAGGRVIAISPMQVTMRVDGRTMQIPRNEDYSLVPLSKSAPYLSARPAAATSPTPPAMTPASGQKPVAGAPSPPQHQAAPSTTSPPQPSPESVPMKEASTLPSVVPGEAESAPSRPLPVAEP